MNPSADQTDTGDKAQGARLVFDVSSLVRRADRRPTGIERVMLEIALCLADIEEGMMFCSYNTDLARFEYVPSARVVELSAQMRGSIESTDAPSNPSNVRTAVRQQMEVGIRRVARRIPTAGPIVKRIVRHLRDAAIETGRVIRLAGRDVWSRHRRNVPRPDCVSQDWNAVTTYCTIDSAFSAHNLVYLAERRAERGFRIALMVHDLIPVVTPQFFSWSLDHLYLDAVRVADVVVVNSDSTERDLRLFAGAHELPVPELVKLPMGSALRDLTPVKPAALTDGSDVPDSRFILCVGTVTIRKNHQLLFDVWEQLIANHGSDDTPPLVVVGTRGWLSDETMSRLHRTPAFRGIVHHISDATDENIAWLYEHCTFTVYPSHYEGWGLPVSESHDFGKVCLTSDRSSLPEAGEGLAELLDPYDRSQWTEHILRYWNDTQHRINREQRIQQHHQRITAHHAADTILTL